MKKPIVALTLSLSALGIAGCSHDGERPPVEQLPSVKATAVPANEITLALTQTVPGTVRAKDHAVVSARMVATVASADFVMGQAVQQGELLVKLSAREAQAKVDQAEAALDQAQRDYERESALLEKGAATSESVRQLEERLRMAKAGLDEAQSMLGYSEITAPFDGRITAKFVNSGDLASPGSPLFRIEGEDRFQVEAQVPASLPDIDLGTELRINANEEVVHGTLAELSPAADPQSRTRLAKIDLPASTDLRSGSFVRVEWPTGEANAVMVPDTAVSNYGQIERVFVVENGHAEMRIVKTGLSRDGQLQILSGLDGSEQVVANPPKALRNGQPLELSSHE